MDKFDFSYFIDYVNSKIHLLDDIKKSPFLIVTNLIDPRWQYAFIQKENLLEDTIGFDWLIYANDGVVYSYKGWNFDFVNPNATFIHQPFLSLITRQKKGL
jgi:hypothetical protein